MRAFFRAAILSCFSFPALAGTPVTYTGKVLPFKIITAIRNYGYADGMRPAQVAISVQGGTQSDWLATAAYVAENSVVNEVTFAIVEVYFPTPWGDKPPQGSKQLAKAYYAGPDPSKSPWPDKQWDVFATGHSPTLADIEFDTLSGTLLEEQPAGTNPDKASDQADAVARKMIIKKYHLPKGWKPNEQLGMLSSDSVDVPKTQIVISDTSQADDSMKALKDCLLKDEGSLFRGCQDTSQEYTFKP